MLGSEGLAGSDGLVVSEGLVGSEVLAGSDGCSGVGGRNPPIKLRIVLVLRIVVGGFLADGVGRVAVPSGSERRRVAAARASPPIPLRKSSVYDKTTN